MVIRSSCLVAGLCLLIISSKFAGAVQSVQGLFPSSYEEYDVLILDPEHGYGSPFGGFSRATRSRLASLPLILPNTDAQDPNTNPFYTEIRDSLGRLYVCRVYHEDELEAGSMLESMFEVPKEKAPLLVADSFSGEALQQGGAVPAVAALDVINNVGENQVGSTDDKSNSQQPPKKKTKAEVETLLEPLVGLCAQTHKGWWSYEWCYKEGITQFHVEISKTTSSVQVKDITSMGDYSDRKFIVIDDDNEEENDTPNTLAQGRPEIARVDDTHTHGSVCLGTSKERITTVHLICCSKSTIQRRKGLVHRDNVHVTTDLMSIYEIHESKVNRCTYNITVCTPLLCQDNDGVEVHDHSTSLEEAESATGGKLKDRRSKPALPPKENESVMEILERTLDGFCLQTSTGGWWTYEICHKKNIRQYHEIVGSRKNKNGVIYTARDIEADHNLGNYQSTSVEAIFPEDEWKVVVNATDKKGGVKKPYFELEYTGGGECDHSDVTDAAIVAGDAGVGAGGIFRASSVRYQCGETYEISVNEDSTCHYIVWVELPDLCKHPLFKEPISKKQAFKCLHVPESMEDGVDPTFPPSADEMESIA